MNDEFASAVLDPEDAFEANELFQAKGWTDGLPIVPPTKEALRTFLNTAGFTAGDLIASEPIRRRNITAEKVCIAAIMLPPRQTPHSTIDPGMLLSVTYFTAFITPTIRSALPQVRPLTNSRTSSSSGLKPVVERMTWKPRELRNVSSLPFK